MVQTNVQLPQRISNTVKFSLNQFVIQLNYKDKLFLTRPARELRCYEGIILSTRGRSLTRNIWRHRNLLFYLILCILFQFVNSFFLQVYLIQLRLRFITSLNRKSNIFICVEFLEFSFIFLVLQNYQIFQSNFKSQRGIRQDKN